jgi:hypothetical protein
MYYSPAKEKSTETSRYAQYSASNKTPNGGKTCRHSLSVSSINITRGSDAPLPNAEQHHAHTSNGNDAPHSLQIT